MPPLVDQFGNTLQPAALRREIAVPSQVRTPTGAFSSSGLDPGRVAGLMRAAAEGDAESYLSLAEEMEERYLHYSAQLATRKRAVSGIEPEIIPASKDKRDMEIAEWVHAHITPVVARATFDMLDAIGKGYSVTEILWQAQPEGWIPAALEVRDPRWFRFDAATQRTLSLIADAGGEGAALTPGKFIVHRAPFKTGIPIRGGLARAAAWGWLFSNFGVQEWATFVEQFGKPLRLGRYAAGAVSPADLEVLFAALQGLGMDAAAMLPDNMAIEFPEVAAARGENGLWRALIEYFDQQISKLVLGQTLTADSGQNGSGSYALGSVHNEVRLDILADDAKRFAETINAQLIPLVVHLNFAGVGAYPQYRIPVEEAADLVALSSIVKEAVAMGQPVSQTWFARKFGIPLPEEGEATLAVEERQDPAPEAATGRNSARRPPPSTASCSLSTVNTDRLMADSGAAMAAWLDAIEPLFEAAEGDMEKFRTLLLAAYPGLSTAAMSDILAPALMAAELQGVFDIEAGG